MTKPSSRWKPGHNPPRPRDYGPKLRKGAKPRWYVVGRDDRPVQWTRVVMQNILGRELTELEVVHHINGDSTDDRPENLRLYANHSEHMRDEYLAGSLPAMH